MPAFIALVAGVLFGAGLAISGMTNPAKILGFLDIWSIARRGWDPTLAVVFMAALAPMLLAYRIQRRMRMPAAAEAFDIPTRTEIDARLLGGAALFGVGWGLVGLCPGPALAALPLAGDGLAQLAAFIVAMLAGIWIGGRS